MCNGLSLSLSLFLSFFLSLPGKINDSVLSAEALPSASYFRRFDFFCSHQLVRPIQLESAMKLNRTRCESYPGVQRVSELYVSRGGQR